MPALFRTYLIIALCGLLVGCISLGSNPVFNDNKIALEGYDPVAYFTLDAAVKGDPEHRYEYNGLTFYFASDSHKQQFVQNPETYIPQYGGYCAYAMSWNLVVSSDPRAFTVRDDKLYLNYSFNVRERWAKNIDDHITDADINWRQKFQSP